MSKCFHHGDFDGCLSAHIVGLYENDDVKFFSMNYNTPIPFNKIEKDERVYIVDFSFKQQEFEKLLNITKNVIWIDHHQTAIEKSKGMPWENVVGIRQVGKAGCELTWECLFPKKQMPTIVKMIGRYDVWDFSTYGDVLHAITCGLKLYDTTPESSIWDILINNEYCIDELIKTGEVAKSFRDNLFAGYLKKCGFVCEFEGYKTICCNMGTGGSMLFDSINKNNYDLMSSFCYNGDVWFVSLYTTKDNINCGEICKKYGGGGHQQAAGFFTKELPFKKSK
jgi:oligoribonuclease NrnB/cAMP/cGMP phosphodiesterase (DHH superfamily)